MTTLQTIAAVLLGIVAFALIVVVAGFLECAIALLLGDDTKDNK